jgi:hypothetical protein
MKSRIRGGDAAGAAVATTERLPVPLQATDVVGPFQPVSQNAQLGKPLRVRKPSARHDVIHAPTADLEAHRAMLRPTFGTSSNEFADTMMGKVISGLKPTAFDILDEATLNAVLATIASLRPESEIEALMCVQTVIAGFSALRMLQLRQGKLLADLGLVVERSRTTRYDYDPRGLAAVTEWIARIESIWGDRPLSAQRSRTSFDDRRSPTLHSGGIEKKTPPVSGFVR